MKRKLVLSLLACILCIAHMSAASPKREFRSVWLSTVWNIDWPADNHSEATSKAELTEYLDGLEGHNFTGVCLQVRSLADALYKSSYEPWSSAITGSRGQNPGWDPLAYAIEECHKRGLECYAWVNPYRISTGTTYTTSFDKEWRNKGWELVGSNGSYVVFNPAMAECRAHILNVIKEIYTNYAIDGMLFDDYFYPSGGTSTSSDADDYSIYKNSGTNLSLAAWRRKNINDFMTEIYNNIQNDRPDMRFGISPAGVGDAPAASYGLKDGPGSDWQYNQIYSEPLYWLKNGIVDFISPQLYWPTDHSTNPFAELSQWWSTAAEKFGRHFYASHDTEDLASYSTSEYIKQVNAHRDGCSNNAPGAIYFSACDIDGVHGGSTTGLGTKLESEVYTGKSLVPVVDWKSHATYGAPSSLAFNGQSISWSAVPATANGSFHTIIRYTVYAIPESVSFENAQATDGDGIDAKYLLGVSYNTSYAIPTDKRSGYYYAVCVYDGYGYEYEPATTLKTIEPSQATTLTAPANGATVEWNTTFSWSDVSNATYKFEISNNSSFSSTIYTKTGLTSTSLALDLSSLLSTNTTYYWRVTTTQTDCEPTVSSYRSFKTKDLDPSTATTLVSPANGATVDWSTTFSWSAVSDAVYTLEISASSSFASTVYTKSNLTATSQTVSLSSLSPNTTYYWRVSTTQTGKKATASSSRSFKTKDLDPSTATTLISPINDAVADWTQTFTWSSVSDATYTLEISETSDFGLIVYEKSGISSTSQSVSLSSFAEDTQYFWRVTTFQTGKKATVSTTATFLTGTSETGKIESGYVITKDPANYILGDYDVENLWMRSTMSDFNNFAMCDDFNRGMIATEDYVYVTGRSANSSSATIYLRRFNALTGEHEGDVILNNDKGNGGYPCNDIIRDSYGNICITNMYLASATSFRILNVNPETGETSEIISLSKPEVRIDHAGIYGDVTTGNYYVFAVGASTKYIYRWEVSDGEEEEYITYTAQAFSPSTSMASGNTSSVSHFGIAPKIIPVSATQVYIDGGNTFMTLYTLSSQGRKYRANIADELTEGHYPGIESSNGMALFDFDGKHFAAYAYRNSDTSYAFSLLSSSGSSILSNGFGLMIFPEGSLGNANSGTYSSPVDAVVLADEVRIYGYTPLNGLSGYRLKVKKITTGVSSAVSDDCRMNIYGDVVTFSEKQEFIKAYNTAGMLVASVVNSDELALPSAGNYIIVTSSKATKVAIR